MDRSAHAEFKTAIRFQIFCFNADISSRKLMFIFFLSSKTDKKLTLERNDFGWVDICACTRRCRVID